MTKTRMIPVLLFAAIISLCFHRQQPGLNLLICETLMLCWLAASKQLYLRSRNSVFFSAGVLLSAIATVVSFSTFAIIVNALAVFLFTGMLIYDQSKSVVTTARLAFVNLVYAQFRFFQQLKNGEKDSPAKSSWIKRSRIFIIPLIVIIFFIFLYRKSNPVFDKITGNIFGYIGDFFDAVFGSFDTAIIFTFVCALFVSNCIFLFHRGTDIVAEDQAASDSLQRVRRKPLRTVATNGLRTEHRMAIFLLAALNAVILVLNILDIYWIWFNFSWEGDYLKQFVHEGTYLLLLSIICSIIIVLYYFRGNQNFYSKNKVLKYLCYAWLLQNAILTISVAIRNFWYIKYFALAHKRIALLAFLLLTLYGLYSVYRKVQLRKSVFYLLRQNALSLYIVLLVSCCFNWDVIIAKYNFAHSDTAFLHLDYCAGLSDKALPILDVPLETLERMNKQQREEFEFSGEYMTPLVYLRTIEARKQAFINYYEHRSLLSWNLPEYLAYEKLKGQKPSLIVVNAAE